MINAAENVIGNHPAQKPITVSCTTVETCFTRCDPTNCFFTLNNHRFRSRVTAAPVGADLVVLFKQSERRRPASRERKASERLQCRSSDGGSACLVPVPECQLRLNRGPLGDQSQLGDSERFCRRLV